MLFRSAKAEAEHFFRAERRAKLKQTGDFLAKSKPTASQHSRGAKLSSKAKAELSGIAQTTGLGASCKFTSFAVKGGTAKKSSTSKAVNAPVRYHLAVGRIGKVTGDKNRAIAVIAKETEGRIVAFRIYNQK